MSNTGAKHISVSVKCNIFCINFFTSPVLFKELYEHGLYACGTVRQTRHGFPEDLRNPSLALGESLFRQNESLTAVVWKDKRPVHVLSTLSQPHEMVTVNRLPVSILLLKYM